MKTLRARLIVGSALIAVVPMAVAMFLFAHQMDTRVRDEAADRLDAALGGMQAQIQMERGRIADQLQALGRDPTLKRLYLVRSGSSRDLADDLAERRRLLGLDILRVVDEGGATVAEAAPGDSALDPALMASAPILYQDQPVGTLQGGILLDANFLGGLKHTSGVELALRDSSGRTVVSTLPGVAETPAPPSSVARLLNAGRPYLGRTLPLALESAPGLQVLGMVSTASIDRAVAALRLTSVLLAIAGLVLAVALGMLWSSQVSAPVEALASFSTRLAQGEWEEPLELQSVRELETLGEALDRMRRDLQSYRARLVVSERQAAWSQMAREVAHEIQNPLTPIAISVADLKRSYEQHHPDFPRVLEQAVRTVGEEVAALKRLLREFSEFGRFPAPQPAPCRVDELVTDLAALYRAEVDAGRLTFTRAGTDPAIFADAGQLKRALVNLIKNGLEAIGPQGRVEVSVATLGDAMEFVVADDGPGLTPEQRAHLFVPGFTTKASGSGLGLTLVERIASDHHGTVAAEPGPRGGTVMRMRLPLRARS
jgi:signal transduction histidine kinase